MSDERVMGLAHRALLLELAAAKHTMEQLTEAVASRTIIGQAQGILMARLDIDEDQALQYLKRLSSHTNRKLIDIAAEIAATRQLPHPH